jgi:hypothetical protein
MIRARKETAATYFSNYYFSYKRNIFFCKIISFVVVFWILFALKFCINLLPGASG